MILANRPLYVVFSGFWTDIVRANKSCGNTNSDTGCASDGNIRRAQAMNDLLVEKRSGFGAESFRHPTRASSIILMVFDVVAVAIAMVVFDWTVQRGVPFLVLLFSILLMRGHYRTRMRLDGGEDAAMLIGAIATAGFIGLMAVAVLDLAPFLLTIVTASVGLLATLMVSRALAFRLLQALRRRGHLRSRAVVVGTGRVTREIGIEFGHRADLGVDIAGYVAVDGLNVEVALPGPVIGNIADLAELTRLTNADRVIVTTRDVYDSRVTDGLRSLTPGGPSVFMIPQLYELGMGADTMTPDRARGFALVRVGRSAHPVLGRQFKRLFDVVAASVALLVLSPLMLLAAIGVKLTSSGPVLFRQVRLGQHLREFELLKFRSLHLNADSDTSWTPDGSEADCTPVGRLLRWSSIDELPQLFNIIRGDMSVVGPRPERPMFVEQFSRTVPGYGHRHRMPVGLTGLAQIRGLRGDTPIVERVKADNLYIDQWSFFGDLRIIAATSWSIARQRSYAEAEVVLDHEILSKRLDHQIVVNLAATKTVAVSARSGLPTDQWGEGQVRSA